MSASISTPVRAPNQARRISLAARLTLWFSLSLAVMLAGTSTYLYRSLKRSLVLEDRALLEDRVQVISSLLERKDAPVEALKLRVESEWARRRFEKIYVRVTDQKGAALAETPGIPALLRDQILRLGPSAASSRFLPLDLADGESLLVLTVEFRPESAGPDRYFSIAVTLDLATQNQVLASYRWRLAMALFLVFLASIFVGRFIAVRGLVPLKAMARSIGEIHASGLSQRVSTSLPVELEVLGRTFNELLDRIQATLDKLSRFSADIAHEIRTPIGNLRGEIEVALAQTRSVEEYQEVLGSGLEECARMKSMVDSLLFLARAEDANPGLQRQDLDLHQELADVIEFYEASVSEAGIRLQTEVPLGVRLRADKSLFQTAIGNLLSNAIRYTPAGGLLAIHAQLESDGAIAIAVRDSGVGIAEEHLGLVFDRLYRVDRQRASSSGENFGLGLAIVRAIMRIHGGRVEIASAPGQGTTVTLRFPK